MSAITQFFFDPVRIAKNNWTIISWWENRRPIFNLAVGTAGLTTVALANLFARLPPHPADLHVPLIVIAGYALMANLGYSLGPLMDVVIRRTWGDEYAAIGPTMFRYGFAFSVGLSLLPIPVAGLSWLVRLLHVLG